MEIVATTTVTNEIAYRSDQRLTAADIHAISKDMKSRKVPTDARIVWPTANAMTVRF